MSEDRDEKLDLSAWDADEPSSDFAAKVLARVRAETPVARPAPADDAAGRRATRESSAARPAPVERARTRRWGAAGGAIAVLALAAAMAVRVGGGPPSRGEAIAAERTEISIGSRARAVLEPGARVAWDGDDVVQAKGDVFYRVEPGARFRVHTPAGDVEVKGTCFTVKVRGDQKEETRDMQKRDVKAGAVGAALSALAFVAVYEGKVAVSHAAERVDLGAGETAQTGADGVRKTGDLAAGQRAFDDKAPEEPLTQANENLVGQVREYRQRLEAIAAQKADLEKKLEQAQLAVATQRADGGKPNKMHEFELTTDDWKELARDGTIKFIEPCPWNPEWKNDPDKLTRAGLSPDDGPALEAAYKKSNARLWAAIKPLCADVLGHADAAERAGASACVHLVLDSTRAKDGAAASEAMRQVAEIRAGLRPMPGPNEPVNPVLRVFLAMTGEAKQFEVDLGQSVGPDDARRAIYSGELCMGRSTFGGPGPREPRENGDTKK